MSPPPRRDWLTQLRNPNDAVGQVIHDTALTLAILLAVGVLLFAISGLWPPLVAIESGSMEPNLNTGDLAFIVEDHRWTGDGAHGETGVTTHQIGQQTGYQTFNDYGDVIVYQPNGDARATPVIHRAHFWVDKGEDWYAKADPAHLQAESCADLRLCPAPNSGFITLGDNNRYYDQSNRMTISSPVRAEWVRGKAKARLPWLGWPRLVLS